MRWIVLLLLLPLVFGIPQPTDAVTLDCGKPVTVSYSESGGEVTFFYSPNSSPEVAKTFLVYFRLSQAFPRLRFLTDGTLTSLGSLSSSLDDYNISLSQAETLAQRYDVDLNVEPLRKKAKLLKETVERVRKEAQQLLEELRDFLDDPRCGFKVDLTPLDDVEDVYFVGDELLREVKETKAKLVDQNADLTLINAISKLITPPFDRTDLDDLLARARADRETLERVLNPSREDIERLLEFSEDYEAYRKASELLGKELITSYRTFPDVQTAITFLIAAEDQIKDKKSLKEIKELWKKVREDIDNGEYLSAYYEVQRLRSKIVELIDREFKEETPKEEGGSVVPLVVGFILVAVLILWVVKRGKKGEEEPDDTLDLYDFE